VPEARSVEHLIEQVIHQLPKRNPRSRGAESAIRALIEAEARRWGSSPPACRQDEPLQWALDRVNDLRAVYSEDVRQRVDGLVLDWMAAQAAGGGRHA
jgi:hypothetical protein